MARISPTTTALACVFVLVTACSASAGVQITQSNHLQARVEEGEPASPAQDPPTLPPIDPVDWHDCPDQPAPWQCSTIKVPLDYRDPEGPPIFVALTRLPASDPALRIGSLVVNPGGPGGSGLGLAYQEAEHVPQSLRDRFDLVGFDPRGVGRSTAARCPSDVISVSEEYEQCVAATHNLLPFLGTVNVARDLEQIRRAIGDEPLTYLGYSYGTAIGAVYADMFPNRVRALVLDGAVDPSAGRANSAGGSRNDFYAEQDFSRTIDVWHQLCDATRACAAGPDSRAMLDRVQHNINDLPTDYFADGYPMTRDDMDIILIDSMYDVSDWAALSVALKDADDGDGSTLAALYSWLLYGYPAQFQSDGDSEFAYYAIVCADFAARGFGLNECGTFPDSADPLPEIVDTHTSTPILVIGTLDDPATPARYAPEMASALGDAVSIEWQGAGHTAFLVSGCITSRVTKYLIDLVAPPDGVRCPFVPGARTVSRQADVVFGALDFSRDVGLITHVLVAEGKPEQEARCIAEQLVHRGNRRIVVHQVLGVESPALVAARRTIERGCTAGDG